MTRKGCLTQEELTLIKEMKNEGATLKYIAFKTGRDKGTISRHIGRKFVHNKWTEADKLTARNLRKQGYVHKEIAKELGRTPDAIRQFFVLERKKGEAI